MPEETGPSSSWCSVPSPLLGGQGDLTYVPLPDLTACAGVGAESKGHLLFYPSYLPRSQWGKGSPGALGVCCALTHLFPE